MSEETLRLLDRIENIRELVQKHTAENTEGEAGEEEILNLVEDATTDFLELLTGSLNGKPAVFFREVKDLVVENAKLHFHDVILKLED